MFLTGISDEMKQNFQVMKEIANETKLFPEDRVRYLEENIKKFNKAANEYGI